MTNTMAVYRPNFSARWDFNKGSVMALPFGVNKASGLMAALAELGIPAHTVVGVGDAENDHAFLAACGCAVAVSNALPSLKAEADIVTVADHGAGVEEARGPVAGGRSGGCGGAGSAASPGGRGCWRAADGGWRLTERRFRPGEGPVVTGPYGCVPTADGAANLLPDRGRS